MDLRRAERRSGLDELVAGREHDDVRPPVHLDVACPHAASSAIVRGPTTSPADDDDRARGDVLATRPDVAAAPRPPRGTRPRPSRHRRCPRRR